MAPDLGRLKESLEKIEKCDGFSESEKAIFRILANGESPKAIKAALKARFGSYEEPARMAFKIQLGRIRGTFDGLHSPFEQQWAEAFDNHIHQLQNIEEWHQLAKDDPEAYSKRLEDHLGEIKKMMKARFGIEAHRPRSNEARDEMIFMLKYGHPNWSFGQVAREYRRGTDKFRRLANAAAEPDDNLPSSKLVQLIYKKRCEQKVDEMIAFVRRDFNPFSRNRHVEWVRQMRKEFGDHPHLQN